MKRVAALVLAVASVVGLGGTAVADRGGSHGDIPGKPPVPEGAYFYSWKGDDVEVWLDCDDGLYHAEVLQKFALGWNLLDDASIDGLRDELVSIGDGLPYKAAVYLATAACV